MCLFFGDNGLKYVGKFRSYNVIGNAHPLKYGLDFSDGWGGYHGILFFKGYTAGTTPAHMLVQAQNEYMNTIDMDYIANNFYDYKTIEEYILFGDPTLKIGGY